MINIQEYVPIEKFDHFHELLCRFGGRYLVPPYEENKRVFVNYVIGHGYKDFIDAWVRGHRFVERRRTQWWRVLARRLGIKLWF